MDAMQRSNLVLAKVLELSMTNGVSHWSLSFDDLELSEDYTTHFYPCIEWLEAEGLIRVGSYRKFMDGIAAGEVNNITLTSKGMAVLGQDILIDGKQQSISTAVRNVSAGRVDYNRIGDALGGILGGFVKSIGS